MTEQRVWWVVWLFVVAFMVLRPWPTPPAAPKENPNNLEFCVQQVERLVVGLDECVVLLQHVRATVPFCSSFSDVEVADFAAIDIVMPRPEGMDD